MTKLFAISLFAITVQNTFIIIRAQPDFVVDTGHMEPVLSKYSGTWRVTYAVTHRSGTPTGVICFHNDKYYIRDLFDHKTTGYEVKMDILPYRVAQVKYDSDQTVKIKKYVDGEQSPFYKLEKLKKFQMAYYIRTVNGNESVTIVNHGLIPVEDDETVKVVRVKILGLHKNYALINRELDEGVALGKCNKPANINTYTVTDEFDNDTKMNYIFDKDVKNAEQSLIFTAKNKA